jgi:DNA-binding transcriptional regulator YiaG
MTGQELESIRSAAGFSQKELAARLGTTPETVSRWECGRRGISEPMERLIRIVTNQD